MSFCMTDQERGYHASEYSAAHWRSSLKVSPCFTHTLQCTLITHLEPTVWFGFVPLRRKGWWTERWAVKEKRRLFPAAEGVDSGWSAPGQSLMELWSADGCWLHQAARTELLDLNQEYRYTHTTATRIQVQPKLQCTTLGLWKHVDHTTSDTLKV